MNLVCHSWAVINGIFKPNIITVQSRSVLFCPIYFLSNCNLANAWLEYKKLPSTQRHLAVTVKIYTWMFFIFPTLCLIRPLLYLIFTHRSLKCSVPLRIALTWLRFRIWLMHFIWKKNIIKFLKIHQLNAKLSTEIGRVNEPLDIAA